MKKIFLLVLASSMIVAYSQKAEDAIHINDVTRIQTFLSSNELRGRRAGTPDIDKAADFLAAEFKKVGLQPVKGNSFLQDFVMVKPKQKELKFKTEGSDFDPKNIVVVTSQKDLSIDEKSGYSIIKINKGENLNQKVTAIIGGKKNTIVLVDTSFRSGFSRLNNLKRQMFNSSQNIVFLLGNTAPTEFKLKVEHEFDEIKFANVVGVLPGKSKKEEYVIFSAHYDHIGVGKPVDGDSIYNGANDDAAGTTAVVALAKYFKKLNNNERTIIFAAFTAEEMGGYGSRYFSEQYDPAKVAAMFNIEMIGTESKWGKNSAYITGFEMTNMGEILQQNLVGSSFAFHPDPYLQQQLFYRSDNATLARLGVPAHTISTAKMEGEPHYHKVSDEVSTLDLVNMVEIIKAIAISSKTIVSGKDTPSRVKAGSMR